MPLTLLCVGFTQQCFVVVFFALRLFYSCFEEKLLCFFFFCVPEDLLDLQIVAVESCSLLIWIITCYVFVYEKETSAKFVFSLLTLSRARLGDNL